jgi:sulfite exporter TauE/SafE
MIGLAGSLHCAGMCGPFVTFYAGTDRDPGRLWPRHLAYNAARLAVYATLGAVAGAVGTAVDLAGRGLHVQRVAAVVAGCAIIAWGAIALLRALGVRLPLPGWLPVRTATSRGLVRLRARPPVARAAILGGLTATLPCGWLYAFVITAAGTGNWLAGAATMVAFWLGTVPMLLGLGLTAQRLAALLGRRLPAMTATVLSVLGLTALFARVPHLSAHPAADESVETCHGAH